MNVIFVVPLDIPVSTPVTEVMVPAAILLLTHVPVYPVVEYSALDAWHIALAPLIVANAFTVTIALLKQPLAIV